MTVVAAGIFIDICRHRQMSSCVRQSNGQDRVSIQSLAAFQPNAILATQVQLTTAMALSPYCSPVIASSIQT
jgi:hypothetical protein